MKFQIIAPDFPNVSRWFSLNRKYPNESTLRILQYESLERFELKGKMLDLGGGSKAKYRSELNGDFEYFSINIDPEIEPTWLVKPGEALPIENEYFDTCISMNTLEHVYDPITLVHEMYRSLKPGGKMYITVPWMFRLHGHPDDFNRTSPSWWQMTLEQAGFSEASVLPLIWGRYSTASAITGIRGPLKKLRGHIPHLKDVLYAKSIRGTDGKYSGRRGQIICNVALGHAIYATK